MLDTKLESKIDTKFPRLITPLPGPEARRIVEVPTVAQDHDRRFSTQLLAVFTEEVVQANPDSGSASRPSEILGDSPCGNRIGSPAEVFRDFLQPCAEGKDPSPSVAAVEGVRDREQLRVVISHRAAHVPYDKQVCSSLLRLSESELDPFATLPEAMSSRVGEIDLAMSGRGVATSRSRGREAP